MLSHWRHFAISAWLVFALAVAADRNVTIPSTDSSIQYTTTTDAGLYNNNSWAQQVNSQCSTQMLTTRLGDSMRFSFLGTAVQLLGTLGVKGGIIQFNVDGTDYPPFSRAKPALACSAVLFQSPLLPYGNHVVSAILTAEEPDLSSNTTAVYGSVLSIQHIIYTTRSKSASNVGPIVGGAVGGVVFAALLAGLIIWWFRRKARQLRALRGPAHASFDDEPAEAHMSEPTAGMIATPFPWTGPNSHITREDRPLMLPNSPSPTSAGFPPTAFARSHSSNNSMDKRGSMSSAAGGFGVANPDDSRGGQSHLVDQIAHRVADIMHSRVGVMDQVAPPPMYDGPEPSGREASALPAKRRSSAASPP